jgi:DNA helicase-2/ATP-dependent DNA helicase PcrA
MSILNDLNDQQKEAVVTTEGPVLILAGAGSGKTRALTHRIAYLVKEKKVSPYNILAVTFTNKAAEEMKVRVAKLLGLESQQKSPKITSPLPYLGTFHSICARILRKEIPELGFERSFSIFDSDDSKQAVKQAMEKLQLSPKNYSPGAIQHYISSAKNMLIGPKEYQSLAQGRFMEIVSQVYPEYQILLAQAQALDFDDLIFKTVELFQKFPLVLTRWQALFRYILIDEYQDTNHAQYTLVKLLGEKYQNICVVGDDFQSIYSFRGANFQNILDFERDYPKAKVIKMEQNYRSTKIIVQAAQKVIENNSLRSKKQLWTANEQGVELGVVETTDERDEAEFILDEIKSLQRAKNFGLKDLNHFVILYRTNAQSRIFEEVLMDQGIPYRLIGALRFYERKEIKDILAYLRFLHNPKDWVSLGRIINVPPRQIGRTTLDAIKKNNWQAVNNHSEKFFSEMDGLRKKVKTLPPAELIDLVSLGTGYKDMLLDGTDEGQVRWENVEELKSVATRSGNMVDFLEQVALVSEIDNLDLPSCSVNDGAR